MFFIARLPDDHCLNFPVAVGIANDVCDGADGEVHASLCEAIRVGRRCVLDDDSFGVAP